MKLKRNIYVYLDSYNEIVLILPKYRHFYPFRWVGRLLYRNKRLYIKLYYYISKLCSYNIKIKIMSKYAGNVYKFSVRDYKKLIALLLEIYDSGWKFDLKKTLKEILTIAMENLTDIGLRDTAVFLMLLLDANCKDTARLIKNVI